jgi:glycerol-3-phosphate acyltransferase PlsY
MTAVIFILTAYLLGSVSFAIVVSKFFKLDDPRTYGSQNPGATNVLRTGNKVAAALTLLGDCVKGWIAVAAAVYLNQSFQLGDEIIAGVAFAVFAGHLWPVFFRFQGGKGVATALGVLLGLNPILGLATLATWLIIARAFRYSSLAALAAAVFAPFYYALLFGLRAPLLAVAVMSALLIYRHRTNIANLLSGKESRIGQKKEQPEVLSEESAAISKSD